MFLITDSRGCGYMRSNPRFLYSSVYSFHHNRTEIKGQFIATCAQSRAHELWQRQRGGVLVRYHLGVLHGHWTVLGA